MIRENVRVEDDGASGEGAKEQTCEITPYNIYISLTILTKDHIITHDHG